MFLRNYETISNLHATAYLHESRPFFTKPVERNHATPSPSRDSITARSDHLMEEPKDHNRRTPDAHTHLPYYTPKLEPTQTRPVDPRHTPI